MKQYCVSASSGGGLSKVTRDKLIKLKGDFSKMNFLRIRDDIPNNFIVQVVSDATIIDGNTVVSL